MYPAAALLVACGLERGTDVSEAALKRIEKAIGKLSLQQQEICAKLVALEERVEKIGAGNGASREEVIRFLDQFRAGEALGEASLGAWIEASDTPCLRGGLRTIQLREGFHARLLEQRIKELGGSAEAEIPEDVYSRIMQQLGSREQADAEKLRDFVARYPDIDAALRPIHELADRLESDQETQSLLRTIAQDERSTLEFLTDACKLLNG